MDKGMSRMKILTFRLLSAALLMLATGSVFGQTVVRGAYLQQLTDSSIIVRWRTSTATDSMVRFGTDSENLNLSSSVAGSRTEHSVQLTGLTELTGYYYSVGDSAGALAGDNTYHFQTAPAAGTPSPTRFWVIGDSGTAVTHPGQAESVRDAFKIYSASAPADFMLMLGDNAYSSGTDQQYQDAVFDTYPVLLSQLPVWPTLGNHDGASADSSSQTGVYYDIFDLPTAAEAGGWESNTEAYYSFDYGDVHFICLDSYDTNRSPDGSMMQWLESDLTLNDKSWVIAFWHHPPYTKGSHNSDTEGALIDMRQNALPILEAWGVDLVMTGHSHSYERSFLLDGHYGVSGTFASATNALDSGDGREGSDGVYEKPDMIAAENAGAVYAVAGSSGKISGGALNHPAMFISLNSLGSMVVDVAGSRLDAVFLNETGLVMDRFTVMKTPDLQPPMIDSVRAEDGTHVIVDYTERVDAVTAADAANYSISGLLVSNAALLAGGRTVRLTTSGMIPGDSYLLTVNNVRDEAGNTMLPDSQAGFDFIQQMTLSFQDGLSPTSTYDGTSDAYIREATATVNYGLATTLQVDGDEPSGSGTDMSIVIGWDVSDIPATATVDAASIHLNTLNVGGPYSCFGLLRDWSQDQVTWNQANAGSSWGAAGAEALSDRDILELCTFNAGSTGPMTIYLNAEGVDLVQSWVDGSAANNGIIFADSVSSNGADFDSSESASATSRPRLEVVYTVPVDPPNQPPTAGFTESCDQLDCTFSDASTDSDGSVANWSWNFGDGGTSTMQNPSHSYATDGGYTVGLTVLDNEGASHEHTHLVSVSLPPPVSDVVADADLFGAGTVSGSYANTHSDGGAVQSIQERDSGGRKRNRYSYLVHTWRFELPLNDLATVYANAWKGNSGDDFVFYWSTDDSNYAELFTIDVTGTENQESAVIPADVSGTVYIQVRDNDQTAGNRAQNTVFVDHLFIRAESAAGGTPPAAPSALEATAVGSSQVDLDWTDNSGDESGFEIERSLDGAVFEFAGNTGEDVTDFSDSGLSSETTYWYRVFAYNASGDSANSNESSATTGDAPAINLDLFGSKSKGRHIVDLEWSGLAGTNVNIFRDGSLYEAVSNSGAHKDETGNKGGRTYTYQVCEQPAGSCTPVESISF